MTLFEYQLLTENEKIDLLYKEGIYIGKRKERGNSIILYQYGDFYVEIYYRKYRCFISHIKCFKSTEPLNPYLEQISIEDLVKCLN